jgi:hypothetical protein
MPPRGVHIDICEGTLMNSQCSCVASDVDDNIVFEEDEEEDEGYLFAGQGRPQHNYLALPMLTRLTYAKHK